MRGLPAAARQSVINQQVKTQTEKIINILASGNSCRAVSKVARYILLNFPTLLSRGSLYTVKAKSVGAGIYDIYLERGRNNGRKHT